MRHLQPAVRLAKKVGKDLGGRQVLLRRLSSQETDAGAMNDGQATLARALTYVGILPPWLGLVLYLTAAPAWAGFAGKWLAESRVSCLSAQGSQSLLSAPYRPFK